MTPAITRFLDFLNHAPTPFQVNKLLGKRLEELGFKKLESTQVKQAQFPGKYYVQHGQRVLLAWQTVKDAQAPIHFTAAHNDSPALKIRPAGARIQNSYLQLGTEIYGGLIISSWFDRPLSIAGRVVWQSKGKMHFGLIDFARPIGILPRLPIHLAREVNDRQSFQKQSELFPIIGQINGKTDPTKAWHKILLNQINRQYPKAKADKIVSYDLMFYPCTPATITGSEEEFVVAPRLDNQASCYAAIEALSKNPLGHHNVVLITDHEECGSQSAYGAASNFLKQNLQALWGENLPRVLAKSFLISCDAAHGVHPNYLGKYEPSHLTYLNQGPVIKTNFNQRYTSNDLSAAIFTALAQQAKVPVQNFVTHGDISCGSTIGPTLAAQLGVSAVDVGIASWAMHSSTETMGIRDVEQLMKVLSIYAQKPLPEIK